MADFDLSTASLTDAATLDPAQIRIALIKASDPVGQKTKVALLTTLIQLILQQIQSGLVTDAELTSALATLQGAIDAKAASSHSHSTAAITGLDTALAGKQPSNSGLTSIAALTPTSGAFLKGAGSGYTIATLSATDIPNLDAGKITTGTINAAVLPALAITDTFTVASQSAMLALTVEPGDIAVRSDISKSFILKTSPASTLSNWVELLSPTSPVQSVAGRTGAVVLTASDITSGTFPDNQIPATITRDTEVESLARSAFSFQPPIDFNSLTGAVSLDNLSMGVQASDGVAITGGSIAANITIGTQSSAAPGRLWRDTNTLRYTDGTGAFRLLLNATDNLANLANLATARSNLKVPASDPNGITGASAVSNIVFISQANYDALGTKDANTLYAITA